MHGSSWKWCLSTVTVALMAAGLPSAMGQESLLMTEDPGYMIRSPHQLTSGSSFAAEDSELAARVADLEAEIAEMHDKAAAAKKKAAGKPSVQVGGRIQLDYALFNQSELSKAHYGDWEDGVEFRRVRLYASGDVCNVIDYKLQMDFADTDEANQGAVDDADGNGRGPDDVDELLQSTAFKDVYITVNELPYVGHIRVGHYKEPFGLEQLTSARHLSFLERSVCDENAFVPARRIGVMGFNRIWNERLTWAAGAFRSELENGAEPPRRFDDDGGTAFTSRITFLPWYDEATEGRGLLHLGADFSHRVVDDDTYRFRARPESHIAPYAVDTGSIPEVDDLQLYAAELAYVYGPLSFQSEWFHAKVNRDFRNDLAFDGMYAYVSYFLTGEHRAYDRSKGAFTRTKPFENFFLVRTCDGDLAWGKGAWEVLYRYSYMDLNDENIQGGLISNHTIGLNWWLNPYTRMMWNYVNSRSTDGDPAVTPMTTQNIYEMRVAIEF